MHQIPVNRYLHSQNKEILQSKGPILDAEIRLPENVSLLRGHQQTYQTRALIDTGATNTCISSAAAKALSLNPIHQIQLRGVNGVVPANVYVIDLTFPGSNILIKGLKVTEAKQLKEPAFDMLLGRDVLSNFLFVYDGGTGAIGLEVPSFTHPLEKEPWKKVQKIGGQQRPDIKKNKAKEKRKQRVNHGRRINKLSFKITTTQFLFYYKSFPVRNNNRHAVSPGRIGSKINFPAQTVNQLPGQGKAGAVARQYPYI